MQYAVMAGVAAASVYGIFLYVRGMVRLRMECENILFWCAFGFFPLVPLITWRAAVLPREHMTIFIALPTVVLVIMWIVTGYLIDSYLKKEKKRKLEGYPKVLPARPLNWLRDNLIFIAVGIVIWCAGQFLHIKDAAVETIMLCGCIFCVIRAVASLWRYRGF